LTRSSSPRPSASDVRARNAWPCIRQATGFANSMGTRITARAFAGLQSPRFGVRAAEHTKITALSMRASRFVESHECTSRTNSVFAWLRGRGRNGPPSEHACVKSGLVRPGLPAITKRVRRPGDCRGADRPARRHVIRPVHLRAVRSPDAGA
jgi:hypothetical protein